MNTSVLISSVAIAALLAGGASATAHKRPHHSHSASASDMYTAPAQPIPYAQLDNYLHATPGARMAMASGSMSQGGESNSANGTGNASGDTPAAAPSDSTASSAAPTPPAGDQMSSGSTSASGTTSPSEDQGKMGQSQPVSPPPPTDGSSPPPK